MGGKYISKKIPQHKVLRTQTAQMTQRFYQIHLPEPNPCCSLEQAAGGIGLHVNWDKTEFMCFN